jgi:hypothetical protein
MEVPLAETAVRARPVPQISPPAEAATFREVFQVTREAGAACSFIVSVLHARNARPVATRHVRKGAMICMIPDMDGVLWPLVPVDAHEPSLSRAPAISAAPVMPVSPSRSAWPFPSGKRRHAQYALMGGLSHMKFFGPYITVWA